MSLVEFFEWSIPEAADPNDGDRSNSALDRKARDIEAKRAAPQPSYPTSQSTLGGRWSRLLPWGS